MTARLNQDCLENFFSQFRELGHHHDHPTPIDVKNRFRLLRLARNSVDLNSSNVCRDSPLGVLSIEDLLNSSDYLSVQLLVGANLGVNVIDNIEEADDDSSQILTELSADDVDAVFRYSNAGNTTQDETSLPPPAASDILSTEALKYVAGYVAFKFQFKYPELGIVSSQLNSQLYQRTVCSPWI